MEKSFSTNEIRNISEVLINNWDRFKDAIKINSAALYHLIGLKKTLIDEGQKVADTVYSLFTGLGCELNPEQTAFIIPPEKRAEANQALTELYKEQVLINYYPIRLTKTDSMPTELMEDLFDFIEFDE